MEVSVLKNYVPGPFLTHKATMESHNSSPTMLHAKVTSDSRNRPKIAPRAPRPSAPCVPTTGRAPLRPPRARSLRPAPHKPGTMQKVSPRCARRCLGCSWTRRSARAMSCQRASKVSANERRYRRGTRRPLCGRTERADTGLRCGTCSGHGVGSTERAARPRTRRTRFLTFTHTRSPASRR
jgi:hypothetical protein